MTNARNSTNIWGAISWLSAAQFFMTQLIVAQAMMTPFNLRYNHISDLGNTACNPMPANLLPSRVNSFIYICSPLHNVMNGSFILLGLGVLLGAVLTRHAFASSRLRGLGLTLIGLAGFCLIIVGFTPENVNIAVHGAAAAVQFIGGNGGIIVIGALLYRPHCA